MRRNPRLPTSRTTVVTRRLPLAIALLAWITASAAISPTRRPTTPARHPTPSVRGTPMTKDARAMDPFLLEVERRAFSFFWNETDRTTGLTKDRADNAHPDTMDAGSIAATGFGLAALPIGVEHGWITRAQGQERALAALRFFDTKAPQRHGIYAHFIQLKTGERLWNSEFSTIDTTLLLAGAVVAGQYFGGEALATAQRLEERVDWNYWSPRHFVSHGSRPEEGEFIGADYGGYSEALLLYILAIGSPSHPVPAALWHELPRDFTRYGPYSTIAGSSLFVNQYPNLFVDFKGKHDRVADYWEVARANTLANRLYGMNLMDRFEGFSPDIWGLTAGDGPDGYAAWAAEPGGAWTDGTINPHAPGGSMMLAPGICRAALAAMRNVYGSKVWGRYGFLDGFNPSRNWWDPHVIGIDTGATLLSIENHQSGLITRLFMRHLSVRRAMQRIGFEASPEAPPSVRVAGLMQVANDREMEVPFRLPAAPAAWGNRPLLLYGGIAERPLTVVLNGRRLGQSTATVGVARAAAFRVPDGLLKWGAQNTLKLRAAGDATLTYGPIHLGPREALEWKPLAITIVE